MKIKITAALIIFSFLLSFLVFAGCSRTATKGTSLENLDRQIAEAGNELDSDENVAEIPNDAVNITQDAQNIEQTLENDTEIISDTELDELNAEIENQNTADDFDLDNDMDFNLNLG